jgi:hypothetical protein
MSRENVEVVRCWWEGFNEDGMPPFALCDEEIELRMPLGGRRMCALTPHTLPPAVRC